MRRKIVGPMRFINRRDQRMLYFGKFIFFVNKNLEFIDDTKLHKSRKTKLHKSRKAKPQSKKDFLKNLCKEIAQYGKTEYMYR